MLVIDAADVVIISPQQGVGLGTELSFYQHLQEPHRQGSVLDVDLAIGALLLRQQRISLHDFFPLVLHFAVSEPAKLLQLMQRQNVLVGIVTHNFE